MHQDSAYFERLFAILSDVDELSHILLKGHLLIEELLFRVIADYLNSETYVERARLSFYQKTHLAHAICGDSADPLIWQMIEHINSLRNAMAHNLGALDDERSQQRLRELHGLAIEDLQKDGITAVPELQDKNDNAKVLKTCVSIVCAYLYGYSFSLLDRRAYREALFSLIVRGVLTEAQREKLDRAEERWSLYSRRT